MIEIALSVHQLVDSILRTGGIDSRAFDSLTMQEGTKLHAIYQSKQDDSYEEEVYFSYTFNYQEFKILLSGRADGVIFDGENYTIDEIKTTNQEIEQFHKENEKWHLGQAICYAYMLALDKNLSEVKVTLTYISQGEGNTVSKKRYLFTIEELKRNVEHYFDEYLTFYKIIIRNNLERNESLKGLKFPFNEIRKGQQELINYCVDVIKNKETIFIEASTGIGKTMACLYSSLRFLNQGVDKILYLCPKNSEFSNALNAMDILSKKGCKAKTIEINAKEKMCPFHLEKECTPDDCVFARTYYSRLNSALKEVLISDDYVIRSEDVLKIANKYEICPFEFSLDLSLYVDIIVCDYNYAYDPFASFKRYFEYPDKQYNLIGLVDEAHNLLSRSRDMFSESLSISELEKIKKVVKKTDNKRIKSAIRKLSRNINLLKKMDFSQEEMIIEQIDDDFIYSIKNLYDAINEYKDKGDFKGINNEIGKIYRFIKTYTNLTNGYKIILSSKNDDITFNLKCIDASEFIRNKKALFYSNIFFSATLSPMDFFVNTLLGNDNYDKKRISSPFDSKNFKVLIDAKTSINYKDRKFTINAVVDEIMLYISTKVGNYIVFVPSFEYLELLEDKINDNSFIFQKRNMKSDDREEFINKFESNPTKTHVGVCVLGGAFSEGLDLTGDRLIGVVVIGVGLPQINFENNLIKDYYEEKNGKGFAFAYSNPGINKVLQAMGRVIRTDEDVGSALLIDKRFGYKEYKSTVLEKYENTIFIDKKTDILKELTTFYKK